MEEQLRPPALPPKLPGKKRSKPMSAGQKTLVGCAIGAGVGFLAIIPLSIVAAIAIPSFLRATLAANEASAISCLRTLCSAEDTFKASLIIDKDGDAVGEFAELGVLAGTDHTASMSQPVDPPFIDGVLGAGQKSGYRFALLVGDMACGTLSGTDAAEEQYLAAAWPVEYGKTGNRSFVVDASGVIRGSDVGGSQASCGAVGDSPWPIIGG